MCRYVRAHSCAFVWQLSSDVVSCFLLSLGMWVWFMNICIRGCVGAIIYLYACRGQRSVLVISPRITFCLPGPAATNSATMSGQQASGSFLSLPPWNGNPTVEPFYVNNGDPNSSVCGCTASTLLSHSPSFIFLMHTRLSHRGNVKV